MLGFVSSPEILYSEAPVNSRKGLSRAQAIILPKIILPMKIAIASSGLGHIARGVEAWALDTANALHQKGIHVTLFAAGHVDTEAPLVVLPCIRRYTHLSNVITRIMPPFTWRWGLRSGYGLEQLTFWCQLKRHLKSGGYDILHLQDPMTALWCGENRAAGRMYTREILAHGTEEPAGFLGRLQYVQHLVPWHMERVLSELHMSTAPEGWTVAPNFVDTDRFKPVQSKEKQRVLRERLGLPPEGFLIGTAAAIKRSHKRIDYIIDEVAAMTEVTRGPPSRHLVIAGATETETSELIAYAEQKLGDHVTFLRDLPFHDMPDFYRCLDVFVLGSLFEMMGIVLAEAMSAGVPALVHNHPVLRYVIGKDGGICLAMDEPGSLSECLASLDDQSIRQMSKEARKRAIHTFSKNTVIGQYIDHYRHILEQPDERCES